MGIWDPDDKKVADADPDDVLADAAAMAEAAASGDDAEVNRLKGKYGK